jgi:hypothetical protein
VLVAAAGCSSSPEDTNASDAATSRGDASDSTSTKVSTSAPSAEGGQEAATDVADAPSDGGATIPVADASAACASYCACMAMNCASEVFAGGCLYQCTTQTNWDLPCRAVMCALVQSQPNNDHCTHASGRVQCVDE